MVVANEVKTKTGSNKAESDHGAASVMPILGMAMLIKDQVDAERAFIQDKQEVAHGHVLPHAGAQ